jgi:hypothetical protein
VQELPPFWWFDRYDLIGLAIAVALAAVLIALGVSIWPALLAGAAAMSGAAFLLRRRAGVPQATIVQRLRRRRARR